MGRFLMKPKIDFAFKEIMMNETARIGFLSAMLKISPEDIKETRILNTNLRKIYEDEKQGILDGISSVGTPEAAGRIKRRQQRYPVMGKIHQCGKRGGL